MTARPIATLLVVILAAGPALPANAGQFKKRMLQVAACGGGAFAGVKLGEKLAEFEARRLKLGAEEAAKHRKAFMIGMALALCGGGAAIAGTTYSRLSKRGQESRQKEIDAALEDAMPTPRTYSDPDNPSLAGTAIAQPGYIADNNKECRVVQDQLGADQAMVKYCRGGNGKWEIET